MNRPVIRYQRKGDNGIEIWDLKDNINYFKKQLLKKTHLLPRNLYIFHFQNNQKSLLLKGKKREYNNKFINIKILSFNVRGLNEKNKISILESFLLKLNIDICLIQESKVTKNPRFMNYFSINKKSYGKKNRKGGLLIIIKNIFKDFTREILFPDLDIMGIQFTDFIIINLYKRHDRNKEINEKILGLLQKYQNHNTIIGGDFNLNENQINYFSKFNFKIILNTKPSRKNNNIDYFITNFNNLKFIKSKTIKNKISDHNAILNKFNINKNWEIKNVYKIKDIAKFHVDFINFYKNKNYQLNGKNFKIFKKQFKVKERIILNIPKKDLKLYNLINKLFENNELIKEIKDRNSKQYFKLINQINIEFEENQNFWKKLNRLRETSSKMILNNENMETSYFGKKESENINWYSKNLKQLENELENFRIKNLENSPSWKVQEYLKIVQINNTINKQQRYLKWKGSTSILKLRNFTNYLNRYSYVMNKNKSKLCELCKKINNLDIIEDLDHFLWNCSAYENNRKIWISELKKINISNILNNNNISNIIIKKDSNSLLALVGNKLIFESLIKFLNKNLGIRANKRGQ
ncbi:DNA-(apurinic or apyrimidinic site) lyase [Anaeramoeba flamelloides]|uniref:DNA-(Apurinic or apyrimidinic site) lyase n=1 Tax=Anaeramoeba flamelloides TaxID=1746091 RepID=A0AAV7YME9_9EUKA|nr:DNA-(apurinic or apyrimidinic site) lyase [Anaeramoeba flamelloides]